MNIPEIQGKIKGWTLENKQTLTSVGIVAGTAIISFYLGFVAFADSKGGVVADCVASSLNRANGAQFGAIKDTKQVSVSSIENLPHTYAAPNIAQNGPFVASKNGKKYYPAGCSAVKRIKDENKIWFDSELSAQKVGLSLATNCN